MPGHQAVKNLVFKKLFNKTFIHCVLLTKNLALPFLHHTKKRKIFYQGIINMILSNKLDH